MSADTSAQPDKREQPPEEHAADPRDDVPRYSQNQLKADRLFVIGSCAKTLADRAKSLPGIELKLLIQLWNTQQTNPNGFRIDGRKLAQACQIARSGMYAALQHLVELCLITRRAGNTRDATYYRVCMFDSIQISGPIFGPLASPRWSENRTTVDLFSDHSGPIIGPAPVEEQRLAAAAASLDLEFTSLTLIDRVLSSKPRDHDKDDVAAWRHRLHGYYAKFGRDGAGRPVQSPHPPPDDIVAQFLAITEPARLETMMDNLELDAITARAHQPGTRSSLNPYNYAWFVTLGLSRVHGIHFQTTKKVRAALRDVKRRPAEPEQQPLIDVRELARKVKSL